MRRHAEGGAGVATRKDGTADGRRGDGGRARGGGRFVLRDWRVATRLTALILVPTLAGVLLAGERVLGSVDRLDGYRQMHSALGYAADLRALAHALAVERDRTSWYLATHQHKSALTAQRKFVDGLVRTVRADLGAIGPGFGARAVQLARQAGRRLDGLPALRQSAKPSSYGEQVTALLALQDQITTIGDDPGLVGAARALSALAHAKEEVSKQRVTLIAPLLAGRRLTAAELEALVAARAQQRARVEAFSADASAADGAFLVKTVAGGNVVRAELTKSWAVAMATRALPLLPSEGRLTAAQHWFDDNTDTITRLHTVEQRVADALNGRVGALRSGAWRDAWVSAGMIFALLLLVLAATVIIARSMVRPLRRLRGEALEVAGRRLPEMVERLRDSDDPEIPLVPPIGLGGRDEIGEVARAFDEVHRQAVRLATEESRLRAMVSAMFVNLSRRTQTLVERQISLIDGLERGERDGSRLADLFKLDHLATRMRRNSENLLVLAGHEAARRRTRPARLIDVVRAAMSEVEEYERVTVTVRRGVAIAGHAANDVVHLLAELIENALSFSPGGSRVMVSSSVFDGGGALLAVGDSGIGIPPDELAEINRRLADPPVVDASVSRRMGLFVVGRLARRHNIRVQLRPGQDSGLVAMALFPPELVVTAPEPARTDPVPRVAPPVPAVSPALSGAGQSALAVTVPFAHPGASPVTAPTPPPVPPPAPPPITPPAARPPVWDGPPPASGGDRLPVVEGSPLDQGEEFLPIFASVESGWFRRPGPGDEPARPALAHDDLAHDDLAHDEPPADDGWTAAEAARAPSLGGVTSAGLPRRRPKANLIPGSAGPAGDPRPAVPPSPERVRSRLASFQQGVRRGRADLARDGDGRPDAADQG